jgi:DNA-binding NarL/FixJ family response regulator
MSDTLHPAYTITVAVVEDDKALRESLGALLKGAPGMELLRACSNGEEALNALPDLKPEVVIMDIQMGAGMNGVECVRRLKDVLPETQVLMFTVFDDGEKLFESLKAGASGYLLKRTAPARLLEAIVEVHEGGSPMSSGVARQMVKYFHGPSAKAAAQVPAKRAGLPGLAPREDEILELLSKGLLYKQIADRLGLSFETVRTYMRSIYLKLHVHSRTEAVVMYLER